MTCFGLGRARGLLALVIGAFRHMAGGAQRFGALEGVAGLHQARIGLHDRALGLRHGGRGAGKAGVVLGEVAYRTRSIAGGVIVHVGVAATMELLALKVLKIL